MKLQKRSWWGKDERVAWRENGRVLTGTVTEPRGDYSWVTYDDQDEAHLVSNDDLYVLTPELEASIKAYAK